MVQSQFFLLQINKKNNCLNKLEIQKRIEINKFKTESRKNKNQSVQTYSPKCKTNYLARVLSTIILIIDKTHKTFPEKNDTDNVTVFTKRLWTLNFDDSFSHENVKDTNFFVEVRRKE